MQKLFFAAATVLLLASFVYAQDASLGPHDFAITYSGQTSATRQGCRGCHIPHGGSVATGLPNRITVFGTGTNDYTTGTNILWDKNIVNNSYQTYSSVNVTGELLMMPSTPTDPAWHSYLCFSCHDGTVAGLNLPGGFMNSADLLMNNGTGDTDLTNDHPVDVSYSSVVMAYPNDYDTLSKVTTGATGYDTQGLPMYGTDSRVECATCHNPHKEPATTTGYSANFLRIATVSDNVTLCRTCHLSKR